MMSPLTLCQLVLLANLLPSSLAGQQWENIRPSASAATQTAAVADLMRRIIPAEFQDFFSLTVDTGLATTAGREVVDLVTVDLVGGRRRVELRGTSGVAVAWGLNHYLKYYCRCQFGWELEQISLSHPLPGADVRLEALDKFRYFFNECTFGYSLPWWDRRRWRRLVDWLAMSGVNLPLAPVGQEYSGGR